MLLELKHRIKNHIARIQAIARHTLRSSTDMESFSSVFSARLQAMANAQDLLTQDSNHTAELRDILQGELRQIFEIAEVDRMLDGPEIRLDGRQSRAMGLVAHELTTNVMKYNSLSDQVALSVRWSIRQEATETLCRSDLEGNDRTQKHPASPTRLWHKAR